MDTKSKTEMEKTTVLSTVREHNKNRKLVRIFRYIFNYISFRLVLFIEVIVDIAFNIFVWRKVRNCNELCKSS